MERMMSVSKQDVERLASAIDKERYMRRQQLAFGGWVNQVVDAVKATNAAIAALTATQEGDDG